MILNLGLNWQEYNQFELVLYRFRPFAGVFRKIVPLEKRKSIFENQGSTIQNIIPITFYQNIIPNKSVVYYIYKRWQNYPVTPLFKSRKDMDDYRKKMGWKYADNNERFIGKVNNYIWDSRVDLQ